MKRNRPPITAWLIIVAGSIALGCDGPAVVDPVISDGVQAQLALLAADRLPDLGMARLSDISTRSTNGHRLLRFSTTIVNVGAGAFELHGNRPSSSEPEMAVSQRIFDDAGGWRDVSTPAVMIYSGDGHDHWHVRDLQRMELFSLNDENVGTGAKRGFCFWDNVEYRLWLAGAPQSDVYAESGCGDPPSLKVAMGLSVGWGDIYPYWLPDQNIDITGFSSGRYRLVVTADPAGWFAEANESNNVTWVDLELSRNGRKVRVIAYGPTA